MRGLAMQPERLYETWADRKEAAQSYLEAVELAKWADRSLEIHFTVAFVKCCS